jgi:hypothetical protein
MIFKRLTNVTVNSNESRISEQTPPSVLVQMPTLIFKCALLLLLLGIPEMD